MPPTLVLDTSVLIAGLRSSTGASFALLELVDSGQFTVGLTAALVLEYEAVCLRSLDVLGLTADDMQQLLDHLCQVGKRRVIRFRLRPSVRDPGDEMVLEAAVASGSQWIVTHNVRDMAAGAARYGVEVITPGEALRRLGV
jgi:putative PIN family toxin of toxin-antitoxin system